MERWWGTSLLERGSYHEPFLGGGAVFFALRSRHGADFRSQLSDRNPEIANLFREVRDHLEELIAVASGWPVDRKTYEWVAREHRGYAPRHAIWSAARTLYLNRCAFNGVYRFGPNGFNVPWGERPPGFPVCDRQVLAAAALALRNSAISDCSFEDAPAPAAGDLVYVDPPYVRASRSTFAVYDGEEFSTADHERLAEWFFELAERGVRVVASNSDGPWVRDLYSRGFVRFVSARRSVGAKTGGEARADEVLVFAGPGVEPGRSDEPFPTLAPLRDRTFVRLDPSEVRARLGLHEEVRVEWFDEFAKWAIYPSRRIPISGTVYVADDQLDDPEFVRQYRSRVLRTIL